jgi:hypothetical protein
MMKSVTGLCFAVLLLLVAAKTGHAAEDDENTPPAGCVAQCRAQYLGIVKYSDAFNRAQEMKALKVFGKPIRQAVGDTDHLMRWRGKEFDFFELLGGDKKIKLEGIFVKGNPAYAPIPSYLLTANGITLDDISQRLRRPIRGFPIPRSDPELLFRQAGTL